MSIINTSVNYINDPDGNRTSEATYANGDIQNQRINRGSASSQHAMTSKCLLLPLICIIIILYHLFPAAAIYPKIKDIELPIFANL